MKCDLRNPYLPSLKRIREVIRIMALLIASGSSQTTDKEFPREKVSKRMAEPEGFEPSIGLYNPITV